MQARCSAIRTGVSNGSPSRKDAALEGDSAAKKYVLGEKHSLRGKAQD